MAEGTIMVLKVDLGCKRCYRKIKKLLCKFPEIRDQTFIEKEDTVIIKVVCCCPEKIRTKLICKGGDSIKSIEVRTPVNPKLPADKPKKTDEKQKPAKDKPKKTDEEPKHEKKTQERAPVPTPVPEYPTGVCCKSCYEGRHGGPCHHGYGVPHQPPSYDGYIRLVPSYDGWASGCRCDRSYGCRCEFVIEENPTCTIL
ncbi:hypothetical protein AAG906_010007 [Vitis piasezkii]